MESASVSPEKAGGDASSSQGTRPKTKSFLSHIVGKEPEIDYVGMDHCYSKPWSAHPDASHAKPIRTLFMAKFPRGQNVVQPDIEVDVETPPFKPVVPYDPVKARTLMTECERHVANTCSQGGNDDWEDNVIRTGWTLQQNRLFNKVMKVLQADRLARLTYESTSNEPIMRRVSVDKTAKRLRQALASVTWNTKLTQWLHGVLLDNLSLPLRAGYLDALQTLRSKIPSLIDRMVALTASVSKPGTISGEDLTNLIKKPWDPMLQFMSQQKPRKLPGNPLIVVAPTGPSHTNPQYNKRTRFWNSQLSTLGKVYSVSVNTGGRVTVSQCLEQLINAVTNKVQELKKSYPSRPVVLVGWSVGASIACQVSMMEGVSAVVCLGFPLVGIHGTRGDVDDALLNSRTPTYFVIGQHANTSNIDDLEDMRERMRAESGLLVVGGADDQLRMSRNKKKQEGLTQIMVDRCIMDEMAEFLGAILTASPVLSPDKPKVPEVREKRKYRKRNTGNTIPPTEVKSRKTSSSRASRDTSLTAEQLEAIKASGKDTQQNTVTETPTRYTRRTAPKRRQTMNSGGPTPSKRSLKSGSVDSPLLQPEGGPSPTAKDTKPLVSVPGAPELSILLQKQKRPLEQQVMIAAPVVPVKPLAAEKTRSVSDRGDDVDGGVSGQSNNSVSVLVPVEQLSTKPQTIQAALESTSQDEEDTSLNVSSTSKTNLSSVLLSIKTTGSGATFQSAASPVASSQTTAPVTFTIPASLTSSLYGLQKGAGKPSTVHFTTALSNSSQIHKLLSSIARSNVSTVTQSATTATTSASATKMSIIGVSQAGEGSAPSHHTVYVQSTGVKATPRTVSVVGRAGATPVTKGSIIGQGGARFKGKTMVSVVNHPPDTEKVQAIQKLQFHDFPLTTATLSRGTPTITQAKILSNSQLDIGKLQALTDSGKATTFHIAVNKSLLTGREGAGDCASPPSTKPGTFSIASLLAQGKATLVNPLNTLAGAAAEKDKLKVVTASEKGVVVTTETLGKVSSLLQSEPGVAKVSGASPGGNVKAVTDNQTGDMSVEGGVKVQVDSSSPLTTSEIRDLIPPASKQLSSEEKSPSVSAKSSPKTPTTSPGGRSTKGQTAVTSYTAKPVLSTVASTRTRRIRTPRHYDL